MVLLMLGDLVAAAAAAHVSAFCLRGQMLVGPVTPLLQTDCCLHGNRMFQRELH